MKKILAALLLLSFTSCNPDCPPDKFSTVILTYDIRGGKDTVNIQYYQDLYLNGSYLYDKNNTAKATNVIAFSVIDVKPISK